MPTLPQRINIHRFFNLGRSAFRLRSALLLPRYVVHNRKSFSRMRKYTLFIFSAYGDAITRKMLQSLGCVKRNLFPVYSTNAASL